MNTKWACVISACCVLKSVAQHRHLVLFCASVFFNAPHSICHFPAPGLYVLHNTHDKVDNFHHHCHRYYMLTKTQQKSCGNIFPKWKPICKQWLSNTFQIRDHFTTPVLKFHCLTKFVGTALITALLPYQIRWNSLDYSFIALPKSVGQP